MYIIVRKCRIEAERTSQLTYTGSLGSSVVTKRAAGIRSYMLIWTDSSLTSMPDSTPY